MQGKLVETIPVAGRYDLAVQGPNRFWHELQGTVTGAAGGVSVGMGSLPLRSGLSVQLANRGDARVTLVLKPLRYGDEPVTVTLKPGDSRELAWPTDKGWYDLQITAAEDDSFRRRLTGRIENGRPGVTA